MKRFMLLGLFMVLASGIEGALPVRKTRVTAESEAEKSKRASAKGRKRAAVKPKKVSVSIAQYYEGRRVKRFIHFLRMYTNPKSHAANKARAAQRMLRIDKGIKTPTYKKYIDNELKKHHLSLDQLQKEAKSAASYLEFNHLINRAALRAKQKKGAKTVPPHMAKKLTDLYHKELPESYKKHALALLEKKGIDFNQLEEAAKPPTSPVKTASAKPSVRA